MAKILERHLGFIVIECECGKKLRCQGFTSTCECDRDYNWAGQQLASRSQWGEETGENYSDITGEIDME